MLYKLFNVSFYLDSVLMSFVPDKNGPIALFLLLQLHLSCINMYCQNTSFIQDNNAHGDLD